MKFTDVQPEGRWSGHLGIPFVIETWGRAGRATRVVVVRVEGQYWGVDKSAEGGIFIKMIVAAALENPRGRGIGLVCDFTGLEYKGGDYLFAWRGIPPLRSVANYQIGVVSSPENRGYIQSLIESDDEEELRANHFHSVAEAVHTFLSRTRTTKS